MWWKKRICEFLFNSDNGNRDTTTLAYISFLQNKNEVSHLGIIIARMTPIYLYCIGNIPRGIFL